MQHTGDAAKERQAAEAILCEVAYLTDRGRASEALALYDLDVTFETPLGVADRVRLEAFLKARETASYQTRHGVTNVRIHDVDAEQFGADCTVFVQRLEPAGPVFQVADWSITCRKREGRWLISRFVVTPFHTPEAG